MFEEAINEEGLTTAEKLDRVYALKIERDHMTADLYAKIAELNQEITAKTALIDPEIKALEGEIIETCMNLGESVRGTYLQVIYTKGKEIFDTARLKAQMPDTYRDFITTTKPSVRIAEIKAKEK